MCAALILPLVYAQRRSGILRIYFLDVGQGDAIYVRTPGGRDMLVDGGPSRSIVRSLSDVMPWHDRRIDVVVETHPDADHIGGLPEIFERYRVGVLLEPGVESNNAIDDELSRARDERGIDSVIARRGMRVVFGDGARFDVLFPDTDVSRYETNAASIVGILRYGRTAVMLTGDSPKAIEDRLVALDGSALGSDILKAGHHGSRTSSGAAFVRAVSPRYAVVSAGKDNRYGHPHKEIVDMFASLGVEMLATGEEGTIEFISDGEGFTRK